MTSLRKITSRKNAQLLFVVYIDLLFNVFQINDFETVSLRAVLFHKALENLSGEILKPGWEKRFYAPIFENQSEALRMLPRENITKEEVANLPDGQKILQDFAQWKAEREKKLFSS